MAGLLAGAGDPRRVSGRWRCSICCRCCRASSMRRCCWPSAPAFLLALAAAFRGVALPDRAAARRRIERASGLPHRPLQALADRPSVPLDPQAAQLWQAHQRRMAAAARRLRIGLPVAGLAARDPWGLRAVLAMLLLLGAVDAGGDWRDRLLRAVTPSLDGGPPAVAASLDIWVTPPEYTGLPPQFLRPENRQTIPVPTGSKLLGPGAWRRGRSRDWRSTASTATSPRSTSRIFGPQAILTRRQAHRGVAGRRRRSAAGRSRSSPTTRRRSPSPSRPRRRRARRCASTIRRPTITGSRASRR